MAGGQHHHRTNLDKYHPGYFGKYVPSSPHSWVPRVAGRLTRTFTYRVGMRREFRQRKAVHTSSAATHRIQTTTSNGITSGSRPSTSKSSGLSSLPRSGNNTSRAARPTPPLSSTSSGTFRAPTVPSRCRSGANKMGNSHGYAKLLGAGRLPEIPVVVRARFVSSEAERKIKDAGGVIELVA